MEQSSNLTAVGTSEENIGMHWDVGTLTATQGCCHLEIQQLTSYGNN